MALSWLAFDWSSNCNWKEFEKKEFENIQFDFNKFSLTQKSKDILDRVAQYLNIKLKLRIYIEDSMGKQSRSREISQQLIDDFEVDILCGIVNSNIALEISRLAEDRQTLFIGAGHSSSRLTEEEAHHHHEVSHAWGGRPSRHANKGDTAEWSANHAETYQQPRSVFIRVKEGSIGGATRGYFTNQNEHTYIGKQEN